MQIYYDEGPTLYELVNQYGFAFADLIGDYPIWDEGKRDWLNGKIYDYFAYREIAQETGGEFGHYLKIKMWQIMPYVNPVAETYLGSGAAKVDFSISGNSVTRQSGSTTNEGTTTTASTGDSTLKTDGTTTADSDSKATTVASEAPQVRLSGEQNYMTASNESGSIGHTTGSETQNSFNHQAGTGETSESTAGTSELTSETSAQGGQLSGLANAWINDSPEILGIIFASLEPLFMQTWD